MLSELAVAVKPRVYRFMFFTCHFTVEPYRIRVDQVRASIFFRIP